MIISESKNTPGFKYVKWEHLRNIKEGKRIEKLVRENDTFFIDGAYLNDVLKYL